MYEIQYGVDHPVAGPVLAVMELPDERFAYVILAVLFQAQLCIGDRYTCEHRYTYSNPIDAIAAFQAWNPESGEEPQGWHRHQPSNRRRHNGDPSTEYIRP